MDAVNLLPLEYRTRKRGRMAAAEGVDGQRALRLGAVVAVVLAALIAGLYLHERSLVHHKQSALAQAQARVAAVHAQVEAIKTAPAATQARVAAAESITA